MVRPIFKGDGGGGCIALSTDNVIGDGGSNGIGDGGSGCIGDGGTQV